MLENWTLEVTSGSQSATPSGNRRCTRSARLINPRAHVGPRRSLVFLQCTNKSLDVFRPHTNFKGIDCLTHSSANGSRRHRWDRRHRALSSASRRVLPLRAPRPSPIRMCRRAASSPPSGSLSTLSVVAGRTSVRDDARSSNARYETALMRSLRLSCRSGRPSGKAIRRNGTHCA
jgi:hypothetical protein